MIKKIKMNKDGGKVKREGREIDTKSERKGKEIVKGLRKRRKG